VKRKAVNGRYLHVKNEIGDACRKTGKIFLRKMSLFIRNLSFISVCMRNINLSLWNDLLSLFVFRSCQNKFYGIDCTKCTFLNWWVLTFSNSGSRLILSYDRQFYTLIILFRNGRSLLQFNVEYFFSNTKLRHLKYLSTHQSTINVIKFVDSKQQNFLYIKDF